MRANAAPATKARGLEASQRSQKEGGSAAIAQLASAISSKATRTHIQISQYGEGNIRLARHSAAHPSSAAISARWVNSHLKPPALWLSTCGCQKLPAQHRRQHLSVATINRVATA